MTRARDGDHGKNTRSRAPPVARAVSATSTTTTTTTATATATATALLLLLLARRSVHVTARSGNILLGMEDSPSQLSFFDYYD